MKVKVNGYGGREYSSLGDYVQSTLTRSSWDGDLEDLQGKLDRMAEFSAGLVVLLVESGTLSVREVGTLFGEELEEME